MRSHLIINLVLAGTCVSTAYADILIPSTRESVLTVTHSQQLADRSEPILTTVTEGYDDMGYWNETISNGAGYAFQESATSESGATASVRAESPFEGSRGAYFDSESSFMFTFHVPDERIYQLTGNLDFEAEGFAPGWQPASSVVLRLTGPGLDIAMEAREPTPVSYQGRLEPGDYTLLLEASAYDFQSVSVAGNATLQLHCPADIDRNNLIDVNDLVAVILEWGASDTDADVNADGVVDVDDLVAVALAWGEC